MKKRNLYIGWICIFTPIFFLAFSILLGCNFKRPDPVKETFLFLKDRISTDKKTLMNIVSTIHEESKKNDLDYRLILAIIKVESNFNKDAISEKGARGLLQIKPSLASFLTKEMGMEWHGPRTLNEPESNIKIGVYFLSILIEEFENLEKALTAYNIGPTRLKETLKRRERPGMAFSKRVIQEYRKNLLFLPDP